MRGVLILLLISLTSSTMAQQFTLNWSVFHPLKKEWIELGEKGSVQELLITTGELPDPFYGTNEEKFGWVEEHEWRFKSIFFVDSTVFDKEFVELDLPSVDTYASIKLNDSLLGETKNAFLPYRYEIKELLKPGMNEVDIVFTPPVLYHKERWETERYHLPAPNDVHDVAIAPYTRKPQYQFGWDWSLRMNTIGINKPVSIIPFDVTRVLNKTMLVHNLFDNQAYVQFKLQISNKDLTGLVWDSKLIGEQVISGGDGNLYFDYRFRDPKLWWPKGYGEQNIYRDIIVLKTSEGQVVDTIHFNFGIKQSELVIEEDQWGTSYYFKINGKRVFCKGANYIPQDIFPARITDDEIRSYVDDMAAANFNIVRVWGGGYYQDEAFYAACDEQGIMVWQDLMFACAMYPGWIDFIDNVAHELEYQLPRVAGHPSVMLFNGNNEVEVAWGNWGFQIKYGLYGQEAKEIEKAYDDIFKETAKNIAAETLIPYIHTSPLSNWGKADYYNHGSQHYWGVWHGKDPIEDFGKKIGRFNAEYGFQSFPEFNTLRSFSTEEDWDISSKVMKQHQKSYVGNNMIMKHAKRLYGSPDDFEEFVYYSQLTQAMAVSMAIAGHRIDAPRCGGTLVWQLNDCWPVSSWSSIDYYGNWKALHYRMRDDYKDVAILAKYNDLNDVDYHLLAELPGSHTVELSYEVFDLKGRSIVEGIEQFKFEDHLNHFIRIDEFNKKRFKKDLHIVFRWKVDGAEVNERSFDEFHSRKGHKEACEDQVEFELINVDLNNKTAQITIKNKKFLRDLWLTSKKFNVRYDRNFTSLLPGNHVFNITFEEEPKRSDFKLYWN